MWSIRFLEAAYQCHYDNLITISSIENKNESNN